MLQRLSVLQELERISDELFVDVSNICVQMRAAWSHLSTDPSFWYAVYHAYPGWQLPLWQGALNDVYEVKQNTEYDILGIDGSQIYPDRHHPISCFLINTGIVYLHYSLQGSNVVFESIPQVFQGFSYQDGTFENSRNVVNCVRQEIEFAKGIAYAQKYKQENVFVLYDGSLIFWHLQSADERMFNRFFPSYVKSLDAFCTEKIPVAGYISSPKGKDLVNLIRFALEQNSLSLIQKEHPAASDMDRMIDTRVISAFLPPFHRSTLFQHRSSLSDQYPSNSRPYFFYINTSTEIARIEIPAWIAQDENLLDQLCTVIVDQCIKGGGYPVCLAEAHEQAVVKGPDRDFFYHALDTIAIKRGYTQSNSTKSIKKLRMNV